MQTDYIQSDETTIPVMNDERHKTVKGYIWLVRSVMTGRQFFYYDKGSRSGKVVLKLFGKFRGAIQTDGYERYEMLDAKKGIILLGCWAHARRHFWEARKNDMQRADYALAQIQLLYDVERKADDERLTYEQRAELRVYPAGMFYFHMDDPVVNVEHEREANDKILKDLKMSGVVNEDFQLIDHMEHTGPEGYLTLPVRATKSGYDKRSSILNTTQLLNLGKYVEKKMTDLGNSLMHGDISIKPYEYEGRKPCEYCEFKNICAYEEGVDQVEKIKKISLEEGKHALDETTAESH